MGQQPLGAPVLERAHSGSSERLQEAGKLLMTEEEGNSIKCKTLEVKSESTAERATRSISAFIVLLQTAGTFPVAQSNNGSLYKVANQASKTQTAGWLITPELFHVGLDVYSQNFFYLWPRCFWILWTKSERIQQHTPRSYERLELRVRGSSTLAGGARLKGNLSSHLLLLKLLVVFDLKQKGRKDDKTLLWAARFPSTRGLPPSSVAERWGVLPEEKRLRKQLDAYRKWHFSSRKNGEVRVAWQPSWTRHKNRLKKKKTIKKRNDVTNEHSEDEPRNTDEAFYSD